MVVPALAAPMVGAQPRAPAPSWGTPQPPTQAQPQLQAPPQTQTPSSRSLDATRPIPKPTPPASRDCSKLVTQPKPSYVRHYQKSTSNGYNDPPDMDLGTVRNTTLAVGNSSAEDHDDLQVRLEQLRCENQNLDAKLDYVIRMLP